MRMTTIPGTGAWARALYVLALLSPGIWLLVIDTSLESFAKLVFAGLLLWVWHLAFTSTRRAMIAALWMFILLGGDLFFFFIYREPPTTPVLLSISETNPGEALDFLRGRVTLLLMFFALSLGVWWIGLRAGAPVPPDCPRRAIVRVLARLALGGLLLSWSLFVLTPMVENLAIHAPAWQTTASAVKKLDRPLAAILIRTKGTFPYGRLVSIGEYMREEMNFKNSNLRKSQFLFHARQKAPPPGRQVYVLVIGETARADHSQLNGYARATAPLLFKEPNLFPLRDIVSPWSFTNHAVPVILNRISAHDGEPVSNEKSIIGAFREAGFKTYWLSNQQPVGLGETVITYFAREAHEAIFLNTSARIMEKAGSYDEQLLAPLKRLINRNEDKSFFVIHLLGSHDSYDKRYPPAFDVFQPSLSAQSNPDHHDVRNKAAVINSFDNSMRYTDYVVAQIIDTVRATHATATVVYSSDHGETLFDDGCTRSGHGSSAKQEFPVSAAIWTSDQHRTYWPNKSAALALNAAKPITTEYLFSSAIDLAGIELDQPDMGHSLASSQFTVQTRWVNAPDRIDWDKAGTRGSCHMLVKK